MNSCIYINIPFCLKRCYYCDFISFTDTEFIPLYLKQLKNEILIRKDEGKDLLIDSIYFGGGTPSLISEKEINIILELIFKNYNVLSPCEITIEANPETLNIQKLVGYRKANISRISIGIQSFDDKVLKGIGRIHDGKKAISAIEMSRTTGFNNINIDLINGLPISDYNTFNKNKKEILNFSPEHISLYNLMVVKNTLLYKKIKDKKLKIPDEKYTNYYWKKYLEILNTQKYIHYEISNFSKNKFECKHNMHYWKRDPYIGFGVAGVSANNKKRYSNTKNLQLYLNRISRSKKAITWRENITSKKEKEETIILGLRMLKEGISKNDINGYDKVKEYIKMEFLNEVGDKLVLTEKGVLVSNQIISGLI